VPCLSSNLAKRSHVVTCPAPRDYSPRRARPSRPRNSIHASPSSSHTRAPLLVLCMCSSSAAPHPRPRRLCTERTACTACTCARRVCACTCASFRPHPTRTHQSAPSPRPSAAVATRLALGRATTAGPRPAAGSTSATDAGSTSATDSRSRSSCTSFEHTREAGQAQGCLYAGDRAGSAGAAAPRAQLQRRVCGGFGGTLASRHPTLGQ
jgi:hypothetical protein